MAFTGCNACLKYFVLVFNLLFCLAGITVVAAGFILKCCGFLRWDTGELGTIVVLSYAGFVILISLFACCGAYRESRCLLGTFIVLIVLAFAGGIVIFFFKKHLEINIWVSASSSRTQKETEDYYMQMIQTKYSISQVETEELDSIQKQLHCCGAYGYEDWANSLYSATREAQTGGGGQSGGGGGPSSSVTHGPVNMLQKFHVPRSCCSNTTGDVCVTQLQLRGEPPRGIYIEGCAAKSVGKIKPTTMQVEITLYLALGVGGAELLVLSVCTLLCCIVQHKSNDVVLNKSGPLERGGAPGDVDCDGLPVKHLDPDSKTDSPDIDRRF